jgi:carboxylesterase type B
MGQSAGASSIMHHITLNGGKRNPPVFRKAILQSPAFFPTPSDDILDGTYTEFLRLTGSKDMDDLITKDTKTLMLANAEMVFKSQYGLFAFGPTVDSDYVPELPGKLLKKDEFHKGISLLLGKTLSDGLLFTPPWVRTNDDIKAHIRKMYPTITDNILTTIINRYPQKRDPTEREQIYRFSDLLDVSFSHLLSNA